MVFRDDLGLALGASFGKLYFRLVFERLTRNAHGDRGGFDTRRGAQSFEDAVGELA